MRVFEKPLPIRRPESYDTDVREGSIRRDVTTALKQKSSLQIFVYRGSEKRPRFSLHCYTNPYTRYGNGPHPPWSERPQRPHTY